MKTGLTSKNEIDAESYWMLVLHNDHVNTQIDVGLAVYDCTYLGNHSKNVMLLAHKNGNAVVGYGRYSTVIRFQKFLNSRNITTSIILVAGRFSKS